MSIDIKALDGVMFEVTITAPTRTAHIVTVSDAYYQTLTRGTMSKEQLIAFSFDFLLAREPGTSILARFELPVIAHYFPEYEAIIKAACTP